MIRAPSRLLLAVAGVVLAVSLFLPWFPGVNGWEHWVWADVVLIVLAADLVAAALMPPLAAHRVVVAVLCGLGIAVVLGHGFEPDDSARAVPTVGPGPYLALGALAAGAIAALVPWPRVAGPLLLVAAAAGLVAALLSGWGAEGEQPLTVGPDTVAFSSAETPNGFERWKVLDVGLVVLAFGLLVAAARRLPSPALAVLAVASVAAGACILIGSRTQTWVAEGLARGAAPGTLAALLALSAALAGLGLVRSHHATPG